MSPGRPAWLRRIVFWQPIESPHQHDFLEALAAVVPCEVILAAESSLPVGRVEQGWRHAPHERVRVVDVSSTEDFDALVAHRGPDALHVFSGFFSHRIVWRAFRQLSTSAARLGILSEAPEQGPWTGRLKRARGRWLIGRWGRRVEFVLAMGSLGRRFFESIGVPRGKIGNFGYYLDVPTAPWPRGEEEADGVFRFVAAGQMIRRKGLDVLIAALAGIDRNGWQCDVYGSGPLERGLRRQAELARLADRVRFHPPMANREVRRAIAAGDCCVVPSRHDGWGMVVNEALIAGTPVVCSDGCGAADMIDDPAAGEVVPAGRVRPLAEALQRRLSIGKIDRDFRVRVHEVARRHDPAAGVRAFLERLADPGPSDR